jgi:hypothetical protein
MLLNKYIPEYDVTEVHSIRVKASPEAIYRALSELTLTEISGIVRLLFWLRSLPEKREKRVLEKLSNKQPMLQSIMKNGFVTIAGNPPQELVFGLMAPGDIGRFWKKNSITNIQFKDADSFMAFTDPNYIRVVANFSIEQSDKPGWVIVRTESRSVGLSKKAFQQFRPYWRIIRPWSGLIRRLWLRGIKRKAERQNAL